jgi:hypothetical protein
MDRNSSRATVGNDRISLQGFDPATLNVVQNENGADRLQANRLRKALGFPWQSSPGATVTVRRNSSAPQRVLKSSPSELPVPQQANRKQTNPACATRSASVLRPGIPGVRSNCQGLSSALAMRVKAQGAPSREKWGRGGEFGSSQGAMHRKGTEYARRKAFPWLGTEDRAPDTTSGRKGLAGPNNRTREYAA